MPNEAEVRKLALISVDIETTCTLHSCKCIDKWSIEKWYSFYDRLLFKGEFILLYMLCLF